jgi:uncharacterized protein (TIGR02118 family)
MRVIAASDGGPSPYYRVSQMSYDSVDDLRAGIASDDGQSTIADLTNFATGGATLLISRRTPTPLRRPELDAAAEVLVG